MAKKLLVNYWRLIKRLVICGILIFLLIQVYLAIKIIPLDIDRGSTGDSVINEEIKQAPEITSQFLHRNKIPELKEDELGFFPDCNIHTKEAISAVRRAKTKECKQMIINTTCSIQNGDFYPTDLPHSCPSNDKVYGRDLGCFQDEKRRRILSKYYTNFASTNTPIKCINVCLQAGYPYAGVQYSTECFCGDTLPDESFKLSAGMCDMTCSGDKQYICGGYFAMNIYETGVEKFTPNIGIIPGKNVIPSVRIVFLLTLNGRALRQVYRLINVLFNSKHYIYIHIDSRQDYLYRNLINLEQVFDNVKLSRERYSTIWGGASLLRMLLHSLTDIQVWEWDFVINLSESDFPIKPLEQLEKFLTMNKGKNFVKSIGHDVQRFIKKQGLGHTFLECDTHMWRIGDRILPKGIVLDGGSDWVALSPQFVKYVTGPKDQLLTGLETIFKHTLLPAESFFHTVLRNTKFCNTYIDNNLHVTNWKRKLGCKCQYKHIVDWCGCSPNDFRTEDWQRIQSTFDRQLFFARKFEPIVNQQVIQKIEEAIGIHDHNYISNVDSYWQSIYNKNDAEPFSAKDDTLLTHSQSIVRLTQNMLSHCNFKYSPLHLIELSSYHKSDVYRGNLLLHQVEIGSANILIETWYKPQSYLEVKEEYLGLVNTFKVSSDFDPKEEIFRNFASILGPLSEPVLHYQFTNMLETHKNYSFVWLNPVGDVCDETFLSLDEQNSTNFVKPKLKVPLTPGVWKVGLIGNNEVIVQTSFLIIPLDVFYGAEVTSQQANVINSGSNSILKRHLHIPGFTLNTSAKEVLQNEITANVMKVEGKLKEWIDMLNRNFYKILGVCIKNTESLNDNLLSCKSITLENCVKTNWSSLSPDPKGTIGNLNKITGKLERS